MLKTESLETAPLKTGPLMLKPEPLIGVKSRPLCPICGKASYSSNGIHPQCAAIQADAPRSSQLRLLRLEEKLKQAAEPKGRPFEKQCPKCKVSLPSRRTACTCGQVFKSY